MIEVFVSDNCPVCPVQLETLQKNFAQDDYRIITVGSHEFDAHPLSSQIDGVPFVVVSDDADGTVKYAGRGLHDEMIIREAVLKQKTKPFNLKKAKLGTSQ